MFIIYDYIYLFVICFALFCVLIRIRRCKKIWLRINRIVYLFTCLCIYNIFVCFYVANVSKFYQFILTSKLPFINFKLNNFEYLFLQTQLVFQQLHFVKSILDKFLNAVSHNRKEQVYDTDNLTNIDAVKLYLFMWYYD